MSGFLKVILLGGSVLIFPGLVFPVHAQEHPLTFEEALSLALEKNPELALERKGLAVAQGELTKAKVYPFNPEVEIEPVFGRSRATEDGGASRFTYGVQVGMSQTLEIRGQRRLRTQRAQANLEQVGWVIKDAERQVRAKVGKAFSSVRVAQERVTLASEIVVLTKELVRVANELFEAGAVPRLDVLRAEVELRRAENELLAAERELAGAKRELALLMGQPPDVDYQAVGPLVFSFVVPDFSRGKALALERRPDLKAAMASLQVAAGEVALVQAEQTFPLVNLVARYEEGRELDTRDRRAVLGLSIPLPLINRRQGELEIALAEQARQVARIELLKARIEKEVAQALERVQASQRIVEQFTKQILPQQEENFKLLREGYELGQFQLTEVLVGRREFIEGRLSYLNAVSELNTALADLEEAIGFTLIGTDRKP